MDNVGVGVPYGHAVHEFALLVHRMWDPEENNANNADAALAFIAQLQERPDYAERRVQLRNQLEQVYLEN